VEEHFNMDTALLLVRLLVGFAIAAHGAQKLFGWFGGHGLAGTGGFFEGLGFRPGRVFALMAGLGEAGGGVLTVLGLGGALGPALIVTVMLVAIFTVHLRNGFWQTNGGYELNTLYIASAIAIAFAGGGAYTVDRALGVSIFESAQWATILMGVAVVLALLNLLARRPAPQEAH
jgi:putative oxidoreductase